MNGFLAKSLGHSRFTRAKLTASLQILLEDISNIFLNVRMLLKQLPVRGRGFAAAISRRSSVMESARDERSERCEDRREDEGDSTNCN